jgi:hypothetical protein
MSGRRKRCQQSKAIRSGEKVLQIFQGIKVFYNLFVVSLPQHRHPTSSEDATFKAVIKMDENHHKIMPRPDNSIRTSPNATTIIELKQGQSSATSDDIRERKSFDFLQTKYELMKRELCESRARIDELEQSLVVRLIEH